MSDAAADPATDGQPATGPDAAAVADAAAAPATVPPVVPPAAAERPELAVGAAFAGGLALALLLKRLAR
jgi:hypothetical protein